MAVMVEWGAEAPAPRSEDHSISLQDPGPDLTSDQGCVAGCQAPSGSSGHCSLSLCLFRPGGSQRTWLVACPYLQFEGDSCPVLAGLPPSLGRCSLLGAPLWLGSKFSRGVHLCHSPSPQPSLCGRRASGRVWVGGRDGPVRSRGA